MKSLRQPIFYILVALALAIAVGWSYYDSYQTKKKANTATTQSAAIANITNVDSKDYDAVTKSEYAAANTKALEANAANKLSALEVTIGKGLAASQVTTRYIFSSPSDMQNNWVYTISQQSGSFIRALIPTADYLGTLQPISLSLLKYNYVAVLQAAEKNGGLDWRQNVSDFSGVIMTLKQDSANALTWSVSYQATSGDTHIEKIDAATNELISS